MKKVANYQSQPRDEQTCWGYTSQFLAGDSHYENLEDECPEVTQDGVRFHVLVDETPFEFLITRQALEDLDDCRSLDSDLLVKFARNRGRIETLALARIDAGARWPNLVLRMHDVNTLSNA